jgi:hypothetical protein
MDGLIKDNTPGNFDYSRFTLPLLDELHLNEIAGLNSTAFANYGSLYWCSGGTSEQLILAANDPVDWNCNNNFTETNIRADINNDTYSAILLTGYTDWPNLVFRGGSIGSLGAPPPPVQTPVQEELTPELDAQIPKLLNVTVASPGIGQAPAGSGLDLVFTITNGGIRNDTYALTPSADMPWGSLAGVPPTLALNAGASTNISIHVAVPPGTPAGNSAQFTLKAVSNAAPGIQDTGYASVTATAPVDTTPPTVAHFRVLFGNTSYDLIGSVRNRLPWQVTGIQVVFSEPITAGSAASLSGISATGFTGLGTNTLTWTFSPISVGSFTAALSETGINALTDAAGNPLAGGAGLNQSVRVLQGDFNDDGGVSSADLVGVNAATKLAYNIFADINGDGVVNSSDITLVRAKIGATLP